NPCSSAEAGQFDFWIGEWNLSWTSKDGKNEEGMNTITKLYGDCVIKEDFKDPNSNFVGMSISTYSVAEKKWKQTWVDNNGSYLDFAGGFSNDRMTLQRKAQMKGKEFLQRMQWYNITARSLDWNWERSDDSGKTWTVIWKIHYTRKS
ncbi:MAG: hypothetical protein ABI623_09150, partial [bacterium]